VIDSTPPVLITPAHSINVQCSAVSESEVVTWLATNGGANATDSCTVVRWSNNFVQTDVSNSCSNPIPITFTASDVCGNSVTTTATLTLEDTTPPVFVNFPNDAELNCDQCSTVECLGEPIAADTCTPDIKVTYTDTVTTGPTILLCPGNQFIVRTFFAQDNCGNQVNQSQNIIVDIARTAGPCNPEQCPPCNSTQFCCTSPVPQVACNPVPCNPVACSSVACIRVPCTAVTAQQCGTPPPPEGIFPPVPYGGGYGVINDCEPIYIYIFDDDDIVENNEVNYEYVYVEVLKNSAPYRAFASLILVVLSIFAVL